LFDLLAVAYNQPKFCSLPSWNSNATTFANSSMVGSKPYGIFIDTNNTVYVVARENRSVRMWTSGAQNETKAIHLSSQSSRSIFVTITGDIYVDNGNSSGASKWTLNQNNSEVAMDIKDNCYGLFVDIENNLYCSMGAFHKIVRRSLNNSANTTKIVAGNGSNGSTSDLLNNPRGIFVNTNLELYIADCGNSRVQRFKPGELNGTTVAGTGSSHNFAFHCPHAVALDADDHLYIVDYNNHRIVRLGSSGCHCLVGCSGSNGSASNQLNLPLMMAFDSYGNIFVTDGNNNRVQKFILSTNSCSKHSYLNPLV
jgi:hypothetical protein